MSTCNSLLFLSMISINIWCQFWYFQRRSAGEIPSPVYIPCNIYWKNNTYPPPPPLGDERGEGGRGGNFMGSFCVISLKKSGQIGLRSIFQCFAQILGVSSEPPGLYRLLSDNHYETLTKNLYSGYITRSPISQYQNIMYCNWPVYLSYQSTLEPTIVHSTYHMNRNMDTPMVTTSHIHNRSRMNKSSVFSMHWGATDCCWAHFWKQKNNNTQKKQKNKKNIDDRFSYSYQ